MERGELERFTGILGRMADLEAAVAELYSACAKAGNKPEFWNGISADERKHESHLRRMAEIVMKRKGTGFSAGRPFAPERIEKFIEYVRAKTAEAGGGKMDQEACLAAANQIERQLLEDRYDQVLKTLDDEYTTMMDRIVKDTEMHVRVTSKKN